MTEEEMRSFIQERVDRGIRAQNVIAPHHMLCCGGEDEYWKFTAIKNEMHVEQLLKKVRKI